MSKGVFRMDVVMLADRVAESALLLQRVTGLNLEEAVMQQ